MGRKSSYSYYSEAGQSASGETPGSDGRNIRAREGSFCDGCNEKKPSTIERKGDLRGEVLCNECADQRQRQAEQDASRSVIERIQEAKEGGGPS